ncbi:hypothetical protein [Oricola thermophila]|uniref:Uncharacterized protein n=1 Tax=Oricola thermophila TaxID=2742145 RepID=A0A6N1VFF8_9HYPH|nr:hypothetical protein [Oricola thermophila]QKV17697.1 hypothetical protein HTY61_04040 [Oricola thermophila]
MRSSVLGPALAALLLAASPAAAGGEHVPAVTDYADAVIRPWIDDPAIVAAVKAQNEATGRLTQEEIEALDMQWRLGVAGGDRSMIDEALSSELSVLLRQRQAEARGVITEIFVTDAKGLNVGQSVVTSDYWQGDEAKWQMTYGTGDADAVFVDNARKDESTGMLQAQVSMTIADEKGEPIGAITVGIDLDAL